MSSFLQEVIDIHGQDFLFLFNFTKVAGALSGILMIIAIRFRPRTTDAEKQSSYECGFDPFLNARTPFDIRFFLVAILFLIFDLEIVFLFPWLTVANALGYFGYFAVSLFLYILTLGFVYEWGKGALEWS